MWGLWEVVHSSPHHVLFVPSPFAVVRLMPDLLALVASDYLEIRVHPLEECFVDLEEHLVVGELAVGPSRTEPQQIVRTRPFLYFVSVPASRARGAKPSAEGFAVASLVEEGTLGPFLALSVLAEVLAYQLGLVVRVHVVPEVAVVSFVAAVVLHEVLAPVCPRFVVDVGAHVHSAN